MQPAPEVLAQERRDRDRRRAQLGPGRAALAPDDELVVIGAQARVERHAEALGAAGDHVALLPHPAELRGQAAERMTDGGRLAGREIAQLGLGQSRAPARGRQPPEERIRGALELVQQARRRRRVVEPAGALAVAPQLSDVAQREPHAEPLGGVVLELVGLVEDHRVVLGEHPDRSVGGDAQTEVGEVERVVDDHDLGVERAVARLLGEAGGGICAARAEAALRPDGDLRPGSGVRHVVELGAVARDGRVEPRAQALDRLAVRRVEEAHAELHDHAPAGVVGATLEQLGADRLAARGGGQREVVAQQLGLQRERRGRDDHAAPRERGGDEIAEALARARAGLADERAALREHVLDALGEGKLRRPLAVRRMRACERPVRRKQPLEHIASVRVGSPDPRSAPRPKGEVVGVGARGVISAESVVFRCLRPYARVRLALAMPPSGGNHFAYASLCICRLARRDLVYRDERRPRRPSPRLGVDRPRHARRHAEPRLAVNTAGEVVGDSTTAG